VTTKEKAPGATRGPQSSSGARTRRTRNSNTSPRPVNPHVWYWLRLAELGLSYLAFEARRNREEVSER
jgi:hypothetical protein